MTLTTSERIWIRELSEDADKIQQACISMEKVVQNMIKRSEYLLKSVD